MTLHDRYIIALTRRGWVHALNPRTGKYTVMTKPGTADLIFVGRSGALRKGRNTTTSVPLNEQFKTDLLLETA